MRLNLKLLLWLLALGSAYITVLFLSRCDRRGATSDVFEEDSLHLAGLGSSFGKGLMLETKVARAHLNQVSPLHESEDGGGGVRYKEIECVINTLRPGPCRREGADVFMPFSFMEKYFEVTGHVAKYEGTERFEWHHSNARIYKPQTKYAPDGVFMSFEHYNVEVRDRVKCITGIEGVPVSTQWGPEGYFYPIQIAQYGLSHYSKYLTETRRTKLVLDDAEDDDLSKWTPARPDGSVRRVHDKLKRTHLIEFSAPESHLQPGVTFHVGAKSNFFLSLDFRFTNNGSITVATELQGKPPGVYYLHYASGPTMLSVEAPNHVYYGMGERTTWGRIHRDLKTDLHKGLKLLKKRGPIKLKPVPMLRIVEIQFHGRGQVDNITLSNNVHLSQFFSAADWLVANQDEKGGWPIAVTRSLANGVLLLDPGWYSAMGQGQAMSLLVRAYVKTNQMKYLDSALQATELFSVPSSEGGVLATFMDKHPWFEEYPTTPSCYVLNGFIYALLGLYDLKKIAPPTEREEAEHLYTAGLQSLKSLLPLFDTGSGSIYDLRHLTLGVAPNLARWDYHATHINQLLLLATLHDDVIFSETAARWIGYTKGKRAAHN